MNQYNQQNQQNQQNNCMILDDDQLNSLSQRIQWRNKDSNPIQLLFKETKEKRTFPTAFQTFKQDGTNFPFYKPEKKNMDQLQNLNSLSPDFEMNSDQINQIESITDLSNNVKCDIELTIDDICKYGIPLLKLTSIDIQPIVDFQPIVDVQPVDYDSDSNYPYYQGTPPLENLSDCTVKYQTSVPHMGRRYFDT